MVAHCDKCFVKAKLPPCTSKTALNRKERCSICSHDSEMKQFKCIQNNSLEIKKTVWKFSQFVFLTLPYVRPPMTYLTVIYRQGSGTTKILQSPWIGECFLWKHVLVYMLLFLLSFTYIFNNIFTVLRRFQIRFNESLHKLSFHFVFCYLTAFSHPNCKSW